MPKSWNATMVFGGLWLAVAALNAYYHSAAFIRKHRREGSSFPFIGGVFAVLAFVALPLHSPFKWGILVAALLLDYGSLPYLLAMVRSLAFPASQKASNKRRDERVRRILESTETASAKSEAAKH
jgi:hypothetical protein